MGLLGGDIGGSPVQQHPVIITLDLYVATGNLESLGSPHPYINQDGLQYLRLHEAQIAPWAFTGLKPSHTDLLMAQRSKIQSLIFTKNETVELFQRPPRTEKVMFYLPLLVMQGEAPFLGDAKITNFMESWKGQFLPVFNAALHVLAEGPVRPPTRVPLIYISRDLVQGYLKV